MAEAEALCNWRSARSMSRISIRLLPRSIAHNSRRLRVKVGSCGSRPTRLPLGRRSRFVVGPAEGFGVLPMTRLSTASMGWALLGPRALVASSLPSGDGTAPLGVDATVVQRLVDHRRMRWRHVGRHTAERRPRILIEAGQGDGRTACVAAPVDHHQGVEVFVGVEDAGAQVDAGGRLQRREAGGRQSLSDRGREAGGRQGLSGCGREGEVDEVSSVGGRGLFPWRQDVSVANGLDRAKHNALACLLIGAAVPFATVPKFARPWRWAAGHLRQPGLGQGGSRQGATTSTVNL